MDCFTNRLGSPSVWGDQNNGEVQSKPVPKKIFDRCPVICERQRGEGDNKMCSIYTRGSYLLKIEQAYSFLLLFSAKKSNRKTLFFSEDDYGTLLTSVLGFVAWGAASGEPLVCKYSWSRWDATAADSISRMRVRRIPPCRRLCVLDTVATHLFCNGSPQPIIEGSFAVNRDSGKIRNWGGLSRSNILDHDVASLIHKSCRTKLARVLDIQHHYLWPPPTSLFSAVV